MDFYLQPLTFRAANGASSGDHHHDSDGPSHHAAHVSHNNMNHFHQSSLFQAHTHRISEKLLVEHRNGILWVWDFGSVTNEANGSGSASSAGVRTRNWQVKGGGVLGTSVSVGAHGLVRGREADRRRTRTHRGREPSPRKQKNSQRLEKLVGGKSGGTHTAVSKTTFSSNSDNSQLVQTHKKSYLHVQEERLRRCRVGSSLVKRLERPVFEREAPHVFDIGHGDDSSLQQNDSRWRQGGGVFHALNTMETSSDVIGASYGGGSFQHQEVDDEYNYEQEYANSKPRMNTDTGDHKHSTFAHKGGALLKGLVDAKSAFLNKKKHTLLPTTDVDSFAMAMLGQDSPASSSPSLHTSKLSRHMSSGNPPSNNLFSKQLSEDERNFMAQFGTLSLAKDCRILEKSKIVQEMPLIPTVHVELHSWSDIVRISRLQKQKDWEKYLLDREHDRECVLNQSNELAEVCARAMRAAADWRSDRIMGNTLKSLQKKKSLWQGPANKYRRKLDSHMRRKTFFRHMVEKSTMERDNAPRIISLQTRKEESKRKVLWALFLLRTYMIEEWPVDETLFFHFCEMYGYSAHMDYKMLMFFKNFETLVGLTSAQVREYKQAQDEGRLSVLRFLSNRHQISEKMLSDFIPKREKAREEFVEQYGDDLFITNAGTNKLKRMDSTFSFEEDM